MPLSPCIMIRDSENSRFFPPTSITAALLPVTFRFTSISCPSTCLERVIASGATAFTCPRRFLHKAKRLPIGQFRLIRFDVDEYSCFCREREKKAPAGLSCGTVEVPRLVTRPNKESNGGQPPPNTQEVKARDSSHKFCSLALYLRIVCDTGRAASDRSLEL